MSPPPQIMPVKKAFYKRIPLKQSPSEKKVGKQIEISLLSIPNAIKHASRISYHPLYPTNASFHTFSTVGFISIFVEVFPTYLPLLQIIEVYKVDYKQCMRS